MNRTQFAATVQAAYKKQFGIDGESSPVMNNAIVVYDNESETFSSQSSLTPVYDSEVEVLTITDGMFGSDDEALTGDAISEFICQVDDLWNEVLQVIETAAE